MEDAIRQADAGAGYNRDGEPTDVARLVRNLILGGEFIMSHITHFYQLAALDYVQGPKTAPFMPYFDDTFYNPVLRVPDGRDRYPVTDTELSGIPRPSKVNAPAVVATGLDAIWDNVIVDYLEALRWRRESLAVVASLAGRTPQVQSIVAGGVNCRPSAAQIDAIQQVVGNDSSGLIGFIKKHYIPLTQIVSYLYGPYGGAVSGAPNDAGFMPWQKRWYDNNGTDIFSGWGAGARNFLSYGVFNQDISHTNLADPDRLLRRGYLYGAGGTGAPSLGNVFANGVTPSYDGAGAATGTACNIVEFIYTSHYRSDASATIAGAAVDPTGLGYTASGIVPWNGYTDPDFETVKGSVTSYSWIKSPRILHGSTNPASAIACQVGPLARMAVTGAREGSASGNVSPVSAASALLAAVESECAGYKLGDRKSNVMLLHPTLAPILAAGYPGGQFAVLTSLFGDIPGTGSGPQSAGFLCGASAMDRHRARAYEALKIAIAMKDWCNQLETTYGGSLTSRTYTGASANFKNFTLPSNTTAYRGRGMHEAPRGALSHWITIVNGKIENYQCVVPTTWNCSPRHAFQGTTDHKARGPVEQAIKGDPGPGLASTTPYISGQKSGTVDVPVEVLRIVHSFDPCIACAVH